MIGRVEGVGEATFTFSGDPVPRDAAFLPPPNQQERPKDPVAHDAEGDVPMRRVGVRAMAVMKEIPEAMGHISSGDQ